MTNKLPTRDQVLQRLAEQLDDATLECIFPGQCPDSIRQIAIGTPSGKNIATDSSSQPLAPAQLAKVPARTSPSGRCRLFTDGASRGHPGQAGAGAVLLAENGEELATCSVYLGTCTNHIAEYKALLLGLEEALRQGCSELTVALDSELIVRQIQGRYKVKNEGLLPLI